MSGTFHDIFVADKQNLDLALSSNVLEQNHLCRCMDLAQMIQWPSGNVSSINDAVENSTSSNRDNEFGWLLGKEGVALFDQILVRLVQATQGSVSLELQNPQQFIIHALHVHDLGKYDEELGRFSGSGHEERSAQIVLRQQENLIQQLGWQDISANFLIALARFHSLLGIVHLGGASSVYLAPLLDWLAEWHHAEQRLFLDLLIILNCCDAGASGNFETQKFYLNHARLNTYAQSADALIQAAEAVTQGKFPDSESALLDQARQPSRLVERIQRIVASNNRLFISSGKTKEALQNVISAGHFDPSGFALTRFDHGTYVFEPLLYEMAQGSIEVSQENLSNLLLLIGLMCQKISSVTVIPLRDSFSMKPDLRPQNKIRFEALLQAVSYGDIEAIRQVICTL